MFPGHQHERELEHQKRGGRTAAAELRGKGCRPRAVGARQQCDDGILQDAQGDGGDFRGRMRQDRGSGVRRRREICPSDWKKENLIITKNGENVSPEELENKIGENRLVQEILVREKEGVIEAEIFPDYEYAKKQEIADVRAALQQIIDEYNKGAAPYKKVYRLSVRETEFEKTPSKKIKRY